jgi:hypothetical protein
MLLGSHLGFKHGFIEGSDPTIDDNMAGKGKSIVAILSNPPLIVLGRLLYSVFLRAMVSQPRKL